MNITNYIVEFIKQGNPVEIKGIGTITPKTIPTHFDEGTKTYYPSVTTVEFSTSCKGDQQIVSYIAKQEFVSITTAEKLWDNYIDALNDKIKTEGKHIFPEMGELTLGAEGGYTFKVQDGLNLSKTSYNYQPLKDVVTYDLDPVREDPFYKFENPTIPQPEPEKPEVEDEEPVKPEEVQEVVEPATEGETKTFDPEIEEEPKVEPAANTQGETEPVAETPENTPAEVPEQTTAKAEEVVESVSEETPENNQKPEQTEEIPMDNDTKKPIKKKKKLLIPIIILLILLLLGGAYYYFVVVKDMPIPFINEKTEVVEDEAITANATEATVATDSTDIAVADTTVTTSTDSETEEIDLFKGVNMFTFDHNLIPIDNADEVIEGTTKTIVEVVEPRMEVFLKRQHYTTAKALMVERLNEYIVKRLKELFDNNFFHPARLVNYDNYITDYCTDKLQRKRVSKAKQTIISEIQVNDLLDEYLNELIAAGLVQRDKIVYKPKPKKVEPAVPVAEMRVRSKQGFDIIAGFFKSRDNAAREADRFRRRGADAYVITKGNLYYVSLGSAPSQTAAEALLRQLRTWNKENMVIKKW